MVSCARQGRILERVGHQNPLAVRQGKDEETRPRFPCRADRRRACSKLDPAAFRLASVGVLGSIGLLTDDVDRLRARLLRLQSPGDLLLSLRPWGRVIPPPSLSERILPKSGSNSGNQDNHRSDLVDVLQHRRAATARAALHFASGNSSSLFMQRIFCGVFGD